MPDKRYQVFVSSTYRDLQEHRQAVTKALLLMDAFPVGMELFPASDDDAWTLITKIIDESDYHLVIVGGTYGSLDPAGISYTEKEYDYAASQNKPIIAFLHADPNRLPRDQTEDDIDARNKLEAFREKAKQRHCKFWKSLDELTLAVVTSFHQLIQTKPAIGWIRGSQARTDADAQQLIQLKTRLGELESELAAARVSAEQPTPIFPEVDIPTRFARFARRFAIEISSLLNALSDSARFELEAALRKAREELLELIVSFDPTQHRSTEMALQTLVEDLDRSMHHASDIEKTNGAAYVHLVGQVNHALAVITRDNW